MQKCPVFISRLIGFTLIALMHSAGAVEIGVRPDRNPVKLNESFQLVFSATQSPDGEPDFTPLKQGFEILNQSQSSNVSLINGNYSKSVSWTLTVLAKTQGNLVIPGISFGQDSSQPYPITVLPVSNAASQVKEDIVLEVSAEPENPYVQAQVIYTVTVLHRIDFAQASLSEPAVDEAIIEKLGDDRHFMTARNGVQYRVTERKYAVFPQKSGPLLLPALKMTAEIYTSRSRGFFGRQGTQSKRIRSKSIQLNVRRKPTGFTGKYWFPAASVSVQQSWSETPPSVELGEPLTHTLTIRAQGAPVNQLPEIEAIKVDASQSGNLQTYPDQPVLQEEKRYDGVFSLRQQKTALIPSQGGKYQIEAIEIPWWNTRTDKMEIARIPAINILAKSPTKSQVNTVENEAQVERKPSTLDSAAIDKTPSSTETSTYWQWLCAFLGMGWIATLIYMGFSSKKASPEPINSIQIESERKRVRKIKLACKQHDPQQTKDALLEWGRVRWPESPPFHLAGLAERCSGGLKSQINHLSNILYSTGSEDWSGSDCWVAFQGFIAKKNQSVKPADSNLEPLFRS